MALASREFRSGREELLQRFRIGEVRRRLFFRVSKGEPVFAPKKARARLPLATISVAVTVLRTIFRRIVIRPPRGDFDRDAGEQSREPRRTESSSSHGAFVWLRRPGL